MKSNKSISKSIYVMLAVEVLIYSLIMFSVGHFGLKNGLRTYSSQTVIENSSAQ